VYRQSLQPAEKLAWQEVLYQSATGAPDPREKKLWEKKLWEMKLWKMKLWEMKLWEMKLWEMKLWEMKLWEMKLCPIHRAFFARWVGGHKGQPSANPRFVSF
jgi:hypothetical protein